jgi:hypothetical protein
LSRRAESLSGSSLCLCGFFFSVLRRRIRFEGMEKTVRDTGYFIDRGQKRGLISFRRFREPADFSNELQRSGANFFLSHGSKLKSVLMFRHIRLTSSSKSISEARETVLLLGQTSF